MQLKADNRKRIEQTALFELAEPEAEGSPMSLLELKVLVSSLLA